MTGRIKALFLSGRIDVVMLDEAVKKRWISPETKNELIKAKKQQDKKT